MEKKQVVQPMMLRTAELFDLPADLVAGLCHMEILGDRQLLLEGHSGILSYGTERIDIGAGALTVRVEGKNLDLRAMTETELRLGGQIASISFLR